MAWPRTRPPSTRCSRPGAGARSPRRSCSRAARGCTATPATAWWTRRPLRIPPSLSPGDLAGEIFNVNDQSRFTVLEMATAAARAAGYKGEVRPTPLPEARKTLGDFADALALSQHIDARKAARLLGWQPRHDGFLDDADVYYRAWKAYREGA